MSNEILILISESRIPRAASTREQARVITRPRRSVFKKNTESSKFWVNEEERTLYS